MEYMLSTGNIQNAADLGLSQNSGFTIIAEKLNYLRWLAHFRSVHRGQYFAQLRTSTVRKMLPESWGFLCPVHTPDGSPCGLLNHLTSPCDVQTHALADPRTARSRIVSELVSKGMVTASSYVPSPGDFIPVMLDGRYEGGMSPDDGPATVDRLRKLKSKGKEGPFLLQALSLYFLPSYHPSAECLVADRQNPFVLRDRAYNTVVWWAFLGVVLIYQPRADGSSRSASQNRSGGVHWNSRATLP